MRKVKVDGGGDRGKKSVYFNPVTKYKLGDSRNNSIHVDCHWFKPVLPPTDPSITAQNALVYTLREIDRESGYPISLNEVLNVVQLRPDPVTPGHFRLAAEDLRVILQAMRAVVIPPNELADTPEAPPPSNKRGGGGSGAGSGGKRGKK
jgi:hypothetical protein